MNANTVIPASSYTPALPVVLEPDKIRNRFFATVLSESILNLPCSFTALIPNRSALLISSTNSSNVVALGYTFASVPLTLMFPVPKVNTLALLYPLILTYVPLVIDSVIVTLAPLEVCVT